MALHLQPFAQRHNVTWGFSAGVLALACVDARLDDCFCHTHCPCTAPHLCAAAQVLKQLILLNPKGRQSLPVLRLQHQQGTLFATLSNQQGQVQHA